MAENRNEQVCLMNMCIIEDNNGNVLALDKVGKNYNGITFPGGHIEHNEVFNYAVIREIKEETGLNIRNPKLSGVYHWYKNNVHNIVFLYKTKDFEGNIISSNEGKVYWIPMEELKKRQLANGTENIIKIIESEELNECVMTNCNGVYKGKIY